MERQKRLVRALVIVMCLCTAVAAQLRQDYSQGILDRGQVLHSAVQVTDQAYPNANLVQVDEFILCEYQPDGTGSTWQDNYTKVLTEKGRRETQNLSFGFLLPYSRAAVKLLELIKPDGSAVPIDIEKQSKVMINRHQMSANIYNPNHKTLQVGVPGVQVGDVVHIVTFREIMRRHMPATWDDSQVFEMTNPIKHGVYEVHAPKDRPLCRIALKDPMEGTVTRSKEERAGRIVYRWEVSDVPRFYSEPHMPPYHTVVQRLLVSTLPDWNAISRWYWQLCEAHLEATTREMQKMVDRLTENLTDRRQKIEAIFHWVSQQVRYMGITIEEESPGWEPHDVRLTFENRHGVCRDKAALLAAMLRLAGFQAYPVLIDTGPRKDTEVPSVAFNHAITGVRNDDGSYLLMDCTHESTKDLLPGYLCNCSYLVAHPQGETLQTSPIVPAEENLALVDTTGEIDATGNLIAETTIRFAGINDNLYRSYLARAKPEERRRLFEGILKTSVATASLTEFTLRPADMQDASENLSVHMRFTADDILVGDGDTVIMPTPHVGTRVGMVNFVIGRMGLKKRRFPLETRYACGVRENLKLRIDPAVGSFISMPQFTPVENQTISWKRELEHRDDCLQGQSEFLIKTVELSPPQYLQCKEDLKQIEYNQRKMPILARRTDTGSTVPDIAILDHRIQYDLADAHNWTERHYARKEILTYKGKKENSELKLNYNPTWEEVSLIRATVSNAGRVRQAGKEEINLMDAGWTASAPRYPGGKTLVVGLPAVEVGSVIEYEYERRKQDRPFFSATHVFRGFNAMARQTVTLTAPASLALQIAKDDNGLIVPDEDQGPGTRRTIVETVEHRDGRIVRQWEAQDQTPVRQEDFLPPMYSFNPILRVTAGNWQTYTEQVLAALGDAVRGQTAAEGRAREIVQDAENPEDKITAIRDFVAMNIRAVGPSLDGLPLDAVTAADRTLADGYGNTTDRAALLYAMLKAVGFSPEFVLINYAPPMEEVARFDTHYPAGHTFGHVLVRLQGSSGPIYLNDTNQYAVLGTTRADSHLALSLADGRTEIVSIPADKKNRNQQEYRLTVTEQGDARIAVTHRSYGYSFAGRHQMFAEMPPEERHRFYQELVAGIAQAAEADGNLVTDFDSYPGVESFRVQVQRYAVRDGDFLYFELPGLLRRLFGLRSDTHENLFFLNWDQGLRVSTVVELPEAFPDVVLAPAPKQWQLPSDGVVRVRVERQEPSNGRTVLAITHEIDVNPFVLAPDRYPDLVEMERQLAHGEARTILAARRRQDDHGDRSQGRHSR